jgi:hypothetical protein
MKENTWEPGRRREDGIKMDLEVGWKGMNLLRIGASGGLL